MLDKENNRLCNLQLNTPQENCKKAAKQRDYAFVSNNHKNKKIIRAINCDTHKVTYYNSMYAVQTNLGINAGIVKMVCEGLNYCRTEISKIDRQVYKFEYVNKSDMPDDCIKSPNIHPKRVATEDKNKHRKEACDRWRQKDSNWLCPNCERTFNNGKKYFHRQKCE